VQVLIGFWAGISTPIWQLCPVVGRPLAQSLQRWPSRCNPAGPVTMPHCRLTSFILHLLLVHCTVQKELEIATLADLLCCCCIWTWQSLLPSSLLEFECLLKVQVAWSFNCICQVAPTAQEWASHTGLCTMHFYLVNITWTLLNEKQINWLLSHQQWTGKLLTSPTTCNKHAWFTEHQNVQWFQYCMLPFNYCTVYQRFVDFNTPALI